MLSQKSSNKGYAYISKICKFTTKYFYWPELTEICMFLDLNIYICIYYVELEPENKAKPEYKTKPKYKLKPEQMVPSSAGASLLLIPADARK